MDSRILEVLYLLADGEFHSGAVMGEKLQLTRTAVWKQLAKFEQYAIPLERQKGRGYRIPGGIELLSESKIRAGLISDISQQLPALTILKSIASTNLYALDLVSNKKNKPLHIVLSEHQTAGKGRYGRTWVSPFGQNIYLSAIASFAHGVTAIEGLSLAVGVAIVNSLTALGLQDIQLKWPNDIWWHDKKLGGILLEMVGDATGSIKIVVGIGLNVNMSNAAVDDAIDQPWIDVKSIANQPIQRNKLVSHILNELIPMLTNFEQQGFEAYRYCWQQHDALFKKPIVVSGRQDNISGIALGVDEKGGLIIQTEQGMKTICGGEVSVRPINMTKIDND